MGLKFDTDSFIKEVNKKMTDKKKAIKRALDFETEKARAYMVEDAPADTGQLKTSIFKKKTGEFERELGAGTEYAGYVEFGTGPKGKGTYKTNIPGVTLTYTDHGWVYYHPEHGFLFTLGHKAQPFFYGNFYKIEKGLKEKIEKILKD